MAGRVLAALCGLGAIVCGVVGMMGGEWVVGPVAVGLGVVALSLVAAGAAQRRADECDDYLFDTLQARAEKKYGPGARVLREQSDVDTGRIVISVPRPDGSEDLYGTRWQPSR